MTVRGSFCYRKTYEEGVLESKRDGSSLGAKSGGGDLGKKGVGGGTDGDVVEVAVNQEQSNGALGSSNGADNSESTGDTQDNSKDNHSPDGEGSATNSVDQEPRSNVAKHGQNLLDDTEVEAHVGGVSGKLLVVGRVGGNEEDTAEGLDAHGGNGDHGAAKVRLAEALQEAGSIGLLADLLQGLGDDSDALLILLSSVAKSLEGADGFVALAVVEEPPGRLGHEGKDDDSETADSVLGNENGAVGPAGGSSAGSLDDEGDDEGSDGEGDGSGGGECSSESQRSNLADIGHADSDEATDGETGDELADEEDGVGSADDFDGDGNEDENVAEQKSPLAADLVRDKSRA